MTARSHRSDGFTLIETIIAVVMIGIVAVVIATTFSVITRTTPSTEARTDDSRSLLGLTNWLSQDVSSTSQTGFDFGYSQASCGTGIPAGTVQLVRLNWSEGGDTYVTDYRYVHDSDTGVIYRYSCRAGEAATPLKLTAALRNATSGALQPAPVVVTPKQDTSGDYTGLEFEVFVYDESGVQRELLSLDAATMNIRTTLPPLGGGGGSTNQAPVATDPITSVSQGGSIVVGSIATDDGTFTITFPSGLPSGVTHNLLGDDLELFADGAATPGTYTVPFDVIDNGSPALTDSGTLTLTVNATTVNQSPTAAPIVVFASPGATSVVDLAPFISDPDGNTPLTITLDDSGLPSNWATPTVGGSPADDLSITPHSTAAGQYVMAYTVTDSLGAVSTAASITINVCDASISSVSPTQVQTTTAGALAQSVTITIQDTTHCGELVLGFKPQAAAAGETVEAFGTGTSVVFGTTEYVWDVPTTNSGINVTLNLKQGANGPIIDTDSLRLRKP